ncbi:hypothetical protein [Agrococcus baldri]|uniref:Lipoprotein n=1 Tax=Agrococcus baldri TaxID=153730 RepID=A0AA87USN9_9MICO|nr:hypothetical protein [Agrococcus baldri]GEK80864.1 hypothetical protein ABA31_22150 [Agrococcus baldri]
MRRARLLAAATLLPALALVVAGCTHVATNTIGGDSVAPTGEQSATNDPQLVAEGLAFDPVIHDVDPDADCDGEAGRAPWESFDRAAWPDLDVTAGETTLTCGNASGAGWRHIADGHAGDFGELAELVGAGWEDVAVFAIDRALEQPTRVEEYRDDIVNYDVLVEYVNGGEAQRSWMVTVGVGLGSGHVITSFPDEQR